MGGGGGASRERAGGTTSNPTPPHHNDPGNGPGGEGGLLGVGCRSGRRYAPGKKTWQQCRIDGGPPSRESPGKHVLILLNQLEGYKGSKQQRCWECNELVSWCCSRCSSAASWLPLHPPIAQGSKKHYGCLAAHRNNPAGGYKVSSTSTQGYLRLLSAAAASLWKSSDGTVAGLQIVAAGTVLCAIVR